MTAHPENHPFSCVLVGQESLLIGCGDLILDRGHKVQAVVTQDADIRQWALSRDIPVLADADALVQDGSPFDWLFSIANLSLLSDAVLALPARGAVNFHDGPLPGYAGLNTPAWALMRGETRHGITWHLLESGIDRGDILAEAEVTITPDDTAFTLNSKCYAAALDSFAGLLPKIEADALQRRAQDFATRSYFARDDRPTAMGRLDFIQGAEALCALVRGLDFGGYANPLTCAKIDLGAQIVVVGGCVAGAGNGAPGTVLNVGADRLVVATGQGAVTLTDLKGFDGVAVDPQTFVAVGDVLPEVAQADALTEALRALTPGERHWRRALQGMQRLRLPLAQPPVGDPQYARQDLQLPEGLSGAALLATLLIWAQRSTGEGLAHLALRTADMDRPAPAARYLNDWVPLRIDADAATVAEVIAATQDQLAAAERFPGFARDLPLRDPAIADFGLPDIGISLGCAGPIAGTCITIEVGATLVIHHETARLAPEALALLAARLETLAEAMIDPQTLETAPLDLNFLPDAERALVTTGWNDTARDYDRALTIHADFEAQVARTPDATALVFEHQELSYAALNAAANRLAHVLRDMGAGPGVPVGLCVRRSPDLLIGALAILKAGAAYVPLDPGYPADRIAHYITDSAAPILVVQEALRDQLPQSAAQVIALDTDPRVAEAPDSNPAGGAGPEDLAYLIYTSGSTGTPKGVMVEHRNVANFFAGMDDRIRHDPPGVWLAVTSLSFDISVLELFYTLARGFKLMLSGEDSRALMSGGPIRMSERRLDFNLFYWGNDDGVGPKKYELLLEGAKFADAHGFNAVWTPERHFHAFGGPYPNPSVTGAAVAAVTKNLAVRAGSCVAPLHHPARIAEEWAVIDNLTNGRVGLAIASGWQPDDFVLRPENTPPDNKPAMYAAIDELRRLWRGEAVEYPTRDGTPFAVVTQPRPVSRELPIWVTTAGNPETWKEAGQIGANVLTHLLGQTVEEVAGKIKIYHAALREAGHDPAAHKVTVMLHTYLADSREEAARVAREPMKDYLRSAAGLIKQYAWAFPAFKKPKGVTNPFQVDLQGLSDEEMDAILEFAFERYFNDSGLFGTVEDGVARAEELRRIGVDEVACLIDYGIATNVVMEGLKPLAEVLARANAPAQVADDDFSVAAQIVRHGVTHLQCTPSMAQMIVTNPEARGALARVEALMIGGEALPGQLVSELRASSAAQIQNMYGPTETTIWSTTHMLGDTPPATAAIGTPIANTQAYVLNDTGTPMPVGVPGELCIGGDGVTRGYWQREAMTAERFVPDPFAGGAARMYRTGDLVFWRADGSLAFLGRTDHQVKIRGHRIELGEIEAALGDLPGVAQAVVVPRDRQGGTQLVGYVIPSQGVLDTDALRRALADRLPDFMVPAQLVALAEFPLTPNKKIDRKALPDPVTHRAAPGPQGAAPTTGIQQQIAEIWSRILGVAGIRAEDNFFALGGHSLLAVQAHRDIRAALGAEALSITDIFRFPTLAGLAAHLSGGSANTPDAPAVVEAPGRAETISKRRAMRAGRGRASG